MYTAEFINTLTFPHLERKKENVKGKLALQRTHINWTNRLIPFGALRSLRLAAEVLVVDFIRQRMK